MTPIAGGSVTGTRYWALRRCVLAMDSDAQVDVVDLNLAAGTAMSLLDEPLAEQLCRAALARSPSFETRLRLGYSLIRQEKNVEGASILRELAASASETDLAIAVCPIAASLFWDSDDAVQAQALLTNTRATIESGLARAQIDAQIDALQASFEAFLARPGKAVRRAESVLVRKDVTCEATAWAYAGASMALAGVGRVRHVDDLVARGWAAALDSETERFLLLSLTNAAVLAYGRAGELGAVAAAVERFEEISAGLPSAQARSALLLFRGQLAWWRGDLPQAARLLDDAAFGFGDPPGAPACWAVQCLLWATAAHAAAGDATAARDACQRAERHGRTAMPIFDADMELARASVAAAEGLLAEAIERAFTSADIARRQGLLAAEAEALHRAARWGDASGAARLAALAGLSNGATNAVQLVEGPRVAIAARQAVALSAADAAGLTDVGDEWGNTGSAVFAAEAYAQAAVLRSRGEVSGPQAARARHLADAHHARTPALIQVRRSGGRLTGREREVASLAALGLSNVQIAARLVISVRTVEGHLLRAYDKLGVHDRGALTRAWAST